MNDGLFTPALFWFGAIVCGLLAFVELAVLGRSLRPVALALLPIFGVNYVLFLLIAAAVNSYLALFFLPIPIIPAVYLLAKWLAYRSAGSISGVTLRSVGLVLLLSLVADCVVMAVALSGFLPINPNRDNLEKAIRDKRNGLLDYMLWTSVVSEPNMQILMNEAIEDENADAVRRLIRRGADPRQVYRLGRSNPETRWRITKWMLDQGVKPEEVDELTDSATLAVTAVSYGLLELDYCLKKGFDPSKSPTVIHEVLRNQTLRDQGTIHPDEVQQIKDKIGVLLAHGADINGGDEYRLRPVFTVLHLAVDMSPVLEFLIEKGTDVRSAANHGFPIAGERDDTRGVTPLMWAVLCEQPQYMTILLNHGVDKNAHDDHGRTALDHARRRPGAEELLRLLR